MDKVPEIEEFTVSIEGNRLTSKIIGDNGTRIKIPSAMWPLKGKRDYCFFSENTIPCEDETIRSIYDSIEFRTGKCYANAEKLRQQLADAGYPAKFFCGWLFVGSVLIPAHHAVVVIENKDGFMLFDPTALNIPRTLQEATGNDARTAFVNWYKEMQSEPRSHYSTFGKAVEGYRYLMTETTYKDALAIRLKLEKAYPKHPAFGGYCDGTKTEIQKTLSADGVN